MEAGPRSKPRTLQKALPLDKGCHTPCQSTYPAANVASLTAVEVAKQPTPLILLALALMV